MRRRHCGLRRTRASRQDCRTIFATTQPATIMHFVRIAARRVLLCHSCDSPSVDASFRRDVGRVDVMHAGVVCGVASTLNTARQLRIYCTQTASGIRVEVHIRTQHRLPARSRPPLPACSVQHRGELRGRRSRVWLVAMCATLCCGGCVYWNIVRAAHDDAGSRRHVELQASIAPCVSWPMRARTLVA